MKTAVISDLHGNLPDYHGAFKDVELLLICGDIVPLNIQANNEKSRRWFRSQFKEWVESLPIAKCIFVAGNHDFWMERSVGQVYNMFPEYNKASYLFNEYATYISNDGNLYTIFGTPYCKVFGNWPFMRENETLNKYYGMIPDNCDIVISHDSPALCGIGMIHQGNYYGEEAGNKILADHILQKKPRYVFSGHIHSGEHSIKEIEGIKLANTSIVDENYDIAYQPLILDITKPQK